MAKSSLLAGLALASGLCVQSASADPVVVVAAENFYGDIAAQVGGANVTVTSILSSPDEDPHLFEASTATLRALDGARVVILNGVDYDPWMEKLLAAHKSPGCREILVANLAHKSAGDKSSPLVQPGDRASGGECIDRRPGDRRSAA